MPGRNEFFRRGIKSGGMNILQFGGTGNDYLTDVQVLSTGDFVVSGYSASSTLDGNANPNAASDFVAIIDKTFPPAGFIKAIVWENHASWYQISGRYNRPHILIDGSDSIYYSYGLTQNIAGTAQVKKLSGTDLSLLATSAAFNDIYGTVDLKVWGDKIVVSRHYWGAGSIWLRFIIMNASDLTTAAESAFNAVGTTENWEMTTPQLIGNHLWIGRGFQTNNYPYYRKMDLTTLLAVTGNFDIFNSLQGIAPAAIFPGSCTDGTYFYFLGYSGKGDTGHLQLLKRDVTNSCNYIGNIVVTCAANNYSDPLYYDNAVYITGGENKAGAVGTYDPYIFKFNTTPAVAYEGYMTYPNGAKIGQLGKTYSMGRRCAVVGPNSFVSVGKTNGNLLGFTNAGGTDCILMVHDENGKII